MSKIILTFSPQMQAAINDERKCCTSRAHQHGNVGDTFSVGGQQFRITHIIQMYADAVTKELHGAEGFTFPAGFINWHARNKGMFDPEQVLYVHFFAAVLPIAAAGYAPAAKV